MNENYGYLFMVNGKHIFVIEENIASAIDKLEKEFNGSCHWALVYSNSIVII